MLPIERVLFRVDAHEISWATVTRSVVWWEMLMSEVSSNDRSTNNALRLIKSQNKKGLVHAFPLSAMVRRTHHGIITSIV